MGPTGYAASGEAGRHRYHDAEPHGISCPDCGSTNLITISMAMGDGRVPFRTCPRCEARWWEKDGSQISRDAALDSVPRS
jgi:ssDNA-binding Zn-finger/Zn-ribbon topoisomerase 1